MRTARPPNTSRSLMRRSSPRLSEPTNGSRLKMKATKRQYRSDPLRSVHLAMKGLHKVGAVDKATIRRFDAACLTPEDIKGIRQQAEMSQAIFALALNVGTSLISQ